MHSKYFNQIFIFHLTSNILDYADFGVKNGIFGKKTQTITRTHCNRVKKIYV